MSPSASSGVGVAHLPNQRHKIVSKRGANFTLMVCGKIFEKIKIHSCPEKYLYLLNR